MIGTSITASTLVGLYCYNLTGLIKGAQQLYVDKSLMLPPIAPHSFNPLIPSMLLS